MIEQITTTWVGLLGFFGFLLVVLSGILIAVWVKRQIQAEDDGA